MDQQMSYFLPPITNTLPTGNCTLREVYRWITEDKSLETVTNELRAFIRKGRVAEYRQLKQRQLPFVTPHGVFSRRKSDAFVSPGGLGVKLFIPGDETVRWAMSYIQLLYADTFKGEVDTCGKDIARCCFLSHDSNAKIFIP